MASQQHRGSQEHGKHRDEQQKQGRSSTSSSETPDGSRKNASSSDAMDDEDLEFDGYDADSPESGRRSSGHEGGTKRPPGGQSGSSSKH